MHCFAYIGICLALFNMQENMITFVKPEIVNVALLFSLIAHKPDSLNEFTNFALSYS